MHRDDIAKRLARIEGQVRGIARMVDEDRYCIDVLDQISAVTRALQQVSIGLLHDHIGADRLDRHTQHQSVHGDLERSGERGRRRYFAFVTIDILIIHHNRHETGIVVIERQDQPAFPGSPAPTGQLLWQYAVTAGDIADAIAAVEALPHDPRLDLVRPTPPAGSPFQNLQPANKAGRRVPLQI